jgi:predicted nucleic acid-binding protein
MSALVFVDTDVLLYARDAGEPGKQPRAAEWLGYLWREQLGRTSTQVLCEYYVNLTRRLDPGLAPDEAWDDVQALLSWRPQPIDQDTLLRGREIEMRYRLSWWDSLIVAAAQLQGCAILLTEDLQDGAVLGGVTVRNPFSFRIEDAAGGSYQLAMPSRRRGRPLLAGQPRRKFA